MHSFHNGLLLILKHSKYHQKKAILKTILFIKNMTSKLAEGDQDQLTTTLGHDLVLID